MKPAGGRISHFISGTPSLRVPAQGITTSPSRSNVKGGELVVSNGLSLGLLFS